MKFLFSFLALILANQSSLAEDSLKFEIRSSLNKYRENDVHNIITQAGIIKSGVSIRSKSHCEEIRQAFSDTFRAVFSDEIASKTKIKYVYRNWRQREPGSPLPDDEIWTCNFEISSPITFTDTYKVPLFASNTGNTEDLRKQCILRSRVLLFNRPDFIALDVSKGWRNGVFHCDANLLIVKGSPSEFDSLDDSFEGHL